MNFYAKTFGAAALAMVAAQEPTAAAEKQPAYPSVVTPEQMVRALRREQDEMFRRCPDDGTRFTCIEAASRQELEHGFDGLTFLSPKERACLMDTTATVVAREFIDAATMDDNRLRERMEFYLSPKGGVTTECGPPMS